MTDKRIELSIPDDFPELPSDAEAYLERLESYWNLVHAQEAARHDLAERRSAHRFRSRITYWLMGLSSSVVVVSMLLVIAKAFGWSKLPDDSVHTLIASVAAQVVGMTFIVVRFFFSKEPTE